MSRKRAFADLHPTNSVLHSDRRCGLRERAHAIRVAAALSMWVLVAGVVVAGCGIRSTAGPGRCAPNCTGETSPSWSPDSRQLAFASDHDGEGDIYVVAARGGRVRKLTNNGAEDSWPSWSPDGRRIAFVSDRDRGAELYVMNPDGSDQTRLTTTDRGEVEGQPAWSPDGRRLAFENYQGCKPKPGSLLGEICTWRVLIVSVDGARQRPFARRNYSAPDWSREGVLAVAGDGGIVVGRADWRRLIPHTFDGDADPTWSPDGHWIAYSRGDQLQLIHPDGTGWRVPIPSNGDGISEDTEPAWSPNGRTLGFSRAVPRTEPIYTPRPASIYLMRPDGKGLRRLRLHWRA